jgi:protoporphyrinogen oxidase
MNKVIILGAGVSGLSLAWKLAESGRPVELIEAKDYIGGLAATREIDGLKMDFGPHSVFSEEREILKTIFDLFGGDMPAGVRDVRLFMQGKYLRYPLNAEDIVMKLGLAPSLKCFFSFIIEKMKPRPEYGPAGPNMEQWSRGQFGKALHELFFKPYTEQFWDVKCSELSPDCIPTYKQMSFTKTLKLLLTPKRKRENYSIIDREVLPLYYPHEGFGAIPERIADKVIELGGKIHTGLKVEEVRTLSNGSYVVSAVDKEGDKREFEGDEVVSTIPIPLFAKALNPAPPKDVLMAAERLQYLSLLVLYLTVDRPHILDCMYEYSLEKPYTRITDVGNFTLVPEDERKNNSISIEQSCHAGDGLWRATKEELFKKYIPHLEMENIIKESEVTGIHLLKASHAYPMYLYDYKKDFVNFTEYCNSIGTLSLCGRTGNFRYMDIDQCMKLSFLLADKMLKKTD